MAQQISSSLNSVGTKAKGEYVKRGTIPYPIDLYQENEKELRVPWKKNKNSKAPSIDPKTLEKQLRQSIVLGMKQFFLVYQPFFDAKSNNCVGAEALLRWKLNNGTIVLPDVFIPVLEQLGLMEIVGEWVFRMAAIQCKKWLDKGMDKNFYMSINVNALQISNSQFSSYIVEFLKRIQLSPEHIYIEITESNMMVDLENGKTQLENLKKNGIRLAIDDFGTGYSSLFYLKFLPVDKIKIDRSFLKNIETDEFSREFIASIIQMTQVEGHVICIEGVENSSQVKILKELKSDIFQGFYFSKPLEPLAFEKQFWN